MKLILQLNRTTDTGLPFGVALHTAISLPRGCGIDEAAAEIEKMAEGFKRTAIELFKADTEGREPDLAWEE